MSRRWSRRGRRASRRRGESVGRDLCPTDGFHPDVVYMEGFRKVIEMGEVLRQNAS